MTVDIASIILVVGCPFHYQTRTGRTRRSVHLHRPVGVAPHHAVDGAYGAPGIRGSADGEQQWDEVTGRWVGDRDTGCLGFGSR